MQGRKLIPFILFFLLCNVSQASFKERITDLNVGLGNLTTHVGKVQKNEGGDTRKFDLNPFVILGAKFHLIDLLSLYPEFGFTIPRSESDEDITEWNFFTLAILGYEVYDWTFRFGFGFYFTRISADGGTKDLPNGSGTTSFPIPEGASTSRNVITNLGVEYFFLKELSARVEASVLNVTSSLARTFNYTISVHYHFGPLSEL